MEEKKFWEIKKYEWGEIGNLKDEHRNKEIKIEKNKVHQIKDRKKGYWVFGGFVKDRNLAKTEDFELKYWMFRADDKRKFHKPKFQCCSKEYNFIIDGEIEGRVGNTKRNIILKAGDYIIIKPGFAVDLQQNIKEDVRGITIKTPSYENDTVKIDECEERFKKSYCKKMFKDFNSKPPLNRF